MLLWLAAIQRQQQEKVNQKQSTKWAFTRN